MSNDSDPIIQLEKVSRFYSPGGYRQVPAVVDVGLEVPSGKTTLLNLIGALDKPSEGRIVVDSVNVGKLSGREQVSYRRSKVGFVFQTFNLIPNMSALENVMFPMEFIGVSGADRKARAWDLLGDVGLPAERFGHRPLRLSGGEQQRVAIARALANSPPLILADEPTGNLDSKAANQVVGLLASLTEDGKRTVLMVTHNAAVANVCNIIVRMQDGLIANVYENA
jgi:putative ABC transport system ATP-binding protein